MPLRLAMSDARLRCQRRAIMEGDQSIGTTEWNSLISETFGELYEEVADSGLRYFETSTTFTTSGLGYLAEPADQLAMVDNIELVLDATSGRCRRLYPIAAQERARWAGRTGDPRRFEMVDDRFYLYPTPAAGKVLTLRYIPQPPDLTNFADADVIDVVTPSGLAFLVWGTALKAMSKDRSDVTLAMQERESARERLKSWAENRAFHQQPRRIVEDDHSDESPDDWAGYWG